MLEPLNTPGLLGGGGDGGGRGGLGDAGTYGTPQADFTPHVQFVGHTNDPRVAIIALC